MHDGVLMSLPSLLGDGECARYVAVHYRIFRSLGRGDDESQERTGE